MSVVLAAKEAVHAAIKTRFAGTSVLVSWADPGKDARTQSVWWTDTVEPDIAPVAMVAGRRKPSDLTAELTIRAVASAPGDPIGAERAVYGLRAVIESAVVDDITPHDVSPLLLDIRPVRAVVSTGETGDGRPAAMCDYTVRLRARIQS